MFSSAKFDQDLTLCSPSTVGVIFKTERDSFRVLDQGGQVRLVQPHQISARGGPNRSIATDSEGHELRKEDMMKEIDGEVHFYVFSPIQLQH